MKRVGLVCMVLAVAGCASEPAPAPVGVAAFQPLRRLNNTEYANTLRDLLHLDAPPWSISW